MRAHSKSRTENPRRVASRFRTPKRHRPFAAVKLRSRTGQGTVGSLDANHQSAQILRERHVPQRWRRRLGSRYRRAPAAHVQRHPPPLNCSARRKRAFRALPSTSRPLSHISARPISAARWACKALSRIIGHWKADRKNVRSNVSPRSLGRA